MDAMAGLQSISSAIADREQLASEDLRAWLDRDLEAKIAALGLFPYEAWSRAHFPRELHHCCGFGLGIWQYPNQLLPLALLLHEYRIESYLEIGVAAGGTFTFICELLAAWSDRENPGAFRALGCDPAPPGCVAYLGSRENPYQQRFKEWLAGAPAVSYAQEFSEFLERRWAREGLAAQTFDCVFVDGDHSYEGCMADLAMALRLGAGVIILHDVVNAECPGVCEAWAEAQRTLGADFDFVEFSAQYDDVKRGEGVRFLGIGVCLRKSMQKRSSSPRTKDAADAVPRAENCP